MLRHILVGVLPFSLMACYPALSGETDAESVTSLTDSSSSESPPTTGGPSCGDGVMDPGEMCDDGDKDETNACLTNCKPASCGDGNVQTGVETCDDGNLNPTDGCEPDCTLTPAKCGDGFKHADEVCEGESPTCDADCTAVECGDGVVNMLAGESCDVESENPTCNEDCTVAMCGDGKLNMMAGETCDNGANVDAPWSMTIPPSDACADSCNAVKYCGDGETLKPNEECDDGNNIDVDGCSNKCTLPVCGDGIQEGGEDCDDENMIDNDDCSNACIAARYIFVSSAAYTGDLGGVSGGNEKCKTLAEATVALKGKNWRAWLSDGDAPLSDDINDFTGWYRLPNGNPVAKGAGQLFSGSLAGSISVDENANAQNGVTVWTGTKANGMSHMSNCDKWTDSTAGFVGAYGGSGNTDANWTEKTFMGTSLLLTCDTANAHIYCVQVAAM